MTGRFDEPLCQRYQHRTSLGIGKPSGSATRSTSSSLIPGWRRCSSAGLCSRQRRSSSTSRSLSSILGIGGLCQPWPLQMPKLGILLDVIGMARNVGATVSRAGMGRGGAYRCDGYVAALEGQCVAALIGRIAEVLPDSPLATVLPPWNPSDAWGLGLKTSALALRPVPHRVLVAIRICRWLPVGEAAVAGTGWSF